MSDFRKIARKLMDEKGKFSALGGLGWYRYRTQRHWLDRAPRSDLVTLTSKVLKHPVLCRPRSSDVHTFYQIFVEREYNCLDDLDTRAECLIVDCGANVGYASAYFLSRFPRCRVVAVEPDPDNFAMLLRNIEPYGDRVSAIRAGVWSHAASLSLRPNNHETGNEWSQAVLECESDTPGSFPAISIGDILESSNFDRISILKVDVEGSEAVLFAGDYDGWLSRVDNMVIELHYGSAFGDTHDSFHRAIEGRGFSMGRSGELTVCRRPPVRPPGR